MGVFPSKEPFPIHDRPARVALPWLTTPQCHFARLRMVQSQLDTIAMLNQLLVDKQLTTCTNLDGFCRGYHATEDVQQNEDAPDRNPISQVKPLVLHEHLCESETGPTCRAQPSWSVPSAKKCGGRHRCSRPAALLIAGLLIRE